MKARIRKTGEIINIADYAKIDLDVCNSLGKPVSVSPEEIELISEKSDIIDWEQRRYEIAKAVLQGIYANPNLKLTRMGLTQYEVFVELAKDAIRQSHALIEELKKE